MSRTELIAVESHGNQVRWRSDRTRPLPGPSPLRLCCAAAGTEAGSVGSLNRLFANFLRLRCANWGALGCGRVLILLMFVKYEQ